MCGQLGMHAQIVEAGLGATLDLISQQCLTALKVVQGEWNEWHLARGRPHSMSY